MPRWSNCGKACSLKGERRVQDFHLTRQLIWLPQQQLYAAGATIALMFLISMLAVRYEIRSKPLSGFEKFWNEQDRERR